MAVSDIFKNMFAPAAPATPAPPPQMGTHGNIPAAPIVTPNPNNPTAPADSNNQKQQDASPLAKFGELWKNDPNAKPAASNLGFDIKPEDILKAAQSVDFTKVVSPEIAARIQAGGEDGMRASLEAMSAVAQNSYAQSAIAAAKIGEEAAKKAVEEMKKQIPGMIKQQSSRDSPFSENAALSGPALEPFVTAIQSRIQTKFPDATAAQLQEMSKEYLVAMAQQIVAGQEAANPSPTTKRGNPKEQDWSKFLE